MALPSVDPATRRTLRRAAEAVLVPVEGYRLREPDGRAAAVITGLALPVIVSAFGEDVPPGMLMREVMQENSQYGFVLVTVVPRRDADQELADGAAFQLTGVLAQLQTPPAVEEIAGQQVNRLVNPDNAAHVVTWAPDGATVVAVVIFGPERAEEIAEALITGAR